MWTSCNLLSTHSSPALDSKRTRLSFCVLNLQVALKAHWHAVHGIQNSQVPRHHIRHNFVTSKAWTLKKSRLQAEWYKRAAVTASPCWGAGGHNVSLSPVKALTQGGSQSENLPKCGTYFNPAIRGSNACGVDVMILARGTSAPTVWSWSEASRAVVSFYSAF